MLSSITPFGERGRHNRYARTAASFVAGAIAGGAALGALAGALGSLLPARRATVDVAIVAVLVLAGAALDGRVGGARLPTIRRQVNEDWLTRYRGWVYGVGFGAQLGFGLVTIVTSAATYVAFALALLTGSLPAGIVIGTTFGAVRGLSLLLGARVHSPDELRRFHRAFEARARIGARVAVAAQTLLGAVALTFLVVAR